MTSLRQRTAPTASRPERGPEQSACHEEPVSDEQRGILTHELVDGPNPGYRIAYVIRITGPLQPRAPRRAAEILSERHDGLRSAFAMMDGRFFRRVHRHVPLELDDIEISPEAGVAERRDAIAAAVRSAVLAPLATEAAPLWRLRVLHFEPNDHAVVWVVHHAIADGWSMNLLMDEFMTCLAEETPVLPAVVPYRAYVDAQPAGGPEAASVSQPDVPDGDNPVWPDLDADRHADRNAGDSVERRLDADFGALLQDAVPALRATPNTILLAAWTALLARYAQASAVRVAMTFVNRPARMFERVVGPCHTTVPVLFQVNEDGNFRQHVAATRAAVEQARTPALAGGTSRSGPRARTSFSVHQGARNLRRVGDLLFEYGDAPIPGSVSDADVFAYCEHDGWRLLLTFRRRALGRADAEDVLRHFAALLHGALCEPARALGMLPLEPSMPSLSDTRAWQIGPPSGELGGGLVARFATRVATMPEAVALVYGEMSLSYAELMRRMEELAAALHAAGARAGDRVGIRAARSPAMVVAQLAVRRLGAAFVPLDPTTPDERLAVIVEDAGLKLVIEAQACGEPQQAKSIAIGIDGALPDIARARGSVPLPSYDPDAEAYVLFTSGSTGRPKGVSCSERALLRVVGDAGLWTIEPDDVVLMCAPTTFDISVFELWNGLLAGRRLVILDPAHHSVEGLAKLVVQHEVTATLIVPRVFHDLLVRAPGVFRTARLVLVGGDINSPADFALCCAQYPSLQLIATFGPTETGVVVTGYRAGYAAGRTAVTAVPIGSALAGARFAIADAKGRPLPPGIPGELMLGGDAVELGYVGAASELDDKFRIDPLERARRIYATGDIAKLRRDGNLEFLGRADRQLKLGGYRIEPAEIEAAALATARLDTCIVAVRPTGNGNRELVAALVPKAGIPAISADDLLAMVREALMRRLPPYMIPARFWVVSHIPTTAHGKTDLGALFHTLGSTGQHVQASQGPLTELVVNLAAAVLDHRDISATSNFFAAGGHSLAAVDLCQRLSAALGRDVPMGVAFEAATLGDIAERLESLLHDAEGRVPLPAVRRGTADCPASFAQHRLLRASGGVPPLVAPLIFRLSDPIDAERLTHALHELVAHHPVLAAGFYRDEEGLLRTRASDNRPALQTVDLASTPAAAREELMRERCRELMAVRRDLEVEPPLRCVLFLCPPAGGILLLIIDHLAYDGRSLTVLSRDLRHLCGAAGNGLPRPELSFLDYAAWEAERVRDGTIARLAAVAAARLADRGRPLWPAEERRAAREPHEAITVTARIAFGAADFRALARRYGVTSFVAVLAIVTAAFVQAKPASHLRIALQTSTRVDRRLFDTIGPFMNTTYLDVPIQDAIEDLARIIQRKLLAAHDDAIVPIDRLLSALGAEGLPTEAALSDVFFSLYHNDEEIAPELAQRVVPLDPQDGWDNESFHSGNAVSMLATLDDETLSVRFGLHPAIRDRTLGERFAPALQAQCARLAMLIADPAP